MGERNNSQLVYDTLDVTEVLNKYLMNHGQENLEALLSGYIKKNLPEIVDKHGLYGVAAILSPETIDKEEFEKVLKQEDEQEPMSDKNENNDVEKTSTSRFAESGIYEKYALPKVEDDAFTHATQVTIEKNKQNDSIENLENANTDEIIIPDQLPKSEVSDENVVLPEIKNNPWADAQTVSPGETFKTRVLQ